LIKIILGTANLGIKYGFLNNELNSKNFDKSLKILKKENFKYIETSLEYKKPLKILNKSNISDFKITLKANFLKPNEEERINKFKKKIRVKNFYCIMLHDPDLLLKKKNIYNKLISLKKNNICQNIGISFYDYDNFFYILKKFNFDIIQVPINLFDQRLIDKNKINFLKNKNIIVQGRSIFLQGLLLKKNHKFSSKKEFLRYNKWLKKNQYTGLYHCINFIKLNNFIKFLVVGVNSFKNLKSIINELYKRKNNFNYSAFATTKKKIVSPYQW
jgi:predicted oxidoreductase